MLLTTIKFDFFLRLLESIMRLFNNNLSSLGYGMFEG